VCGPTHGVSTAMASNGDTKLQVWCFVSVDCAVRLALCWVLCCVMCVRLGAMCERGAVSSETSAGLPLGALSLGTKRCCHTGADAVLGACLMFSVSGGACRSQAEFREATRAE